MKFKYPRSNFEDLLNKKGYSFNGATGSVKEYFDAQYGGTSSFSFDLGPIVTLDKGYAYYGKNDEDGNDLHPEEMVASACRLSDSEVDFSLYDNVFVYFAGGNPSDESADDNAIWPHSWSLKNAGIFLRLDGKEIDYYSCNSELTNVSDTYSSKDISFTTIGTFCHEFCHLLGLCDMYDTDGSNNGNAVELGPLSIMSYGNWLNYGRTPPNFTAVERMQLGLVTPSSMEEGSYSLKPGDVLIRESATDGEYYLFEYREAEGWDKYIGGSGLTIYHVDQSKSVLKRWEENKVNAYKSHPCVQVVAPSNKYASDSWWYANPFWPYLTNNSFSSKTTPSFSYWNGSSDILSLKNIASGQSCSQFDVAGVVSIESLETFPDAVISQWQFSGSQSYGVKIDLCMGGTVVQSKSYKNVSDEKVSVVFENINPDTDYILNVTVNGNGTTYYASKQFKTDSFVELPYIFTGDLSTYSSGEIRKNQKIPLRIIPDEAVSSVNWTLDGSTVKVSSDGYYYLQRSGRILARVTYKSGRTVLIAKEFLVK